MYPGLVSMTASIPLLKLVQALTMMSPVMAVHSLMMEHLSDAAFSWSLAQALACMRSQMA